MGTEIIVRKTEEYKENPETIRIWKSIMADNTHKQSEKQHAEN